MQSGTYIYLYRRPDGSFETRRLKVEILSTVGLRRSVRFLGVHADGRGFGTITSVFAKNVKTKKSKPEKKEIAEIRLPYKD